MMVKRTDTLCAMAPKQPVMHNLPIHFYYRSADNLLLKADSARLEGDDENLYVFLLRWTSLLMDTIPQHTDANGPQFAAKQMEGKKRLLGVMDELETLKETINRRFAALDDQPASSSASIASSKSSHYATPTESFHHSVSASSTSTASSSTPLLRSGTAPSAPPLQPPLGSTWSMPTAPARSQAASQQVAYPSLQGADPMAKLHSLSIREPRPPAHAAMPLSSPPPAPSAAPMPLHRTPSLPPQPVMVNYQTAPPPGQIGRIGMHGPDLCRCCQPPPFWHQPSGGRWPPARGQAAPPPPRARNLVAGFKDVHIDPRLLEEFLRVADNNTRANLETCAILAGRLTEGAFMVTTLLIPKQESTSDTCSTLDEEGLFNFMDARSLCSLGWVHTHPTQTCFMSSVDLHTHAGYQTLLDESVAIVMAPQDPARRFGIFRLVTPSGLRMIQQCRERGFHPHSMADGGEIYEHSSHVLLDERLHWDVADLRTLH